MHTFLLGAHVYCVNLITLQMGNINCINSNKSINAMHRSLRWTAIYSKRIFQSKVYVCTLEERKECRKHPFPRSNGEFEEKVLYKRRMKKTYTDWWLCIQQFDRWEVKKLLISFKFALIGRSYRLQCDEYGWEEDICKKCVRFLSKYYVFNRNAPNCNNNETSVIATKHEGKQLEPFYISSFKWHCIELHYLIESFFTRSSIPMNYSFVRSMARLLVLSLFCFHHLQFFFY